MEIRVELDEGVLRMLAHRNLAYEPNVHIFILWMLGAAIVLLTVAILFLRNQIRPILRLAGAAQDFGKGRDFDFRPHGAREVRQAGYAFIEMKRRVERSVEQRTAMLNGVSHDLRTILTRFKLSLAVMDEQAEIEPLQKDVDEMQGMLEGYLAFARGDAGEPTVSTDLRTMLDELKSDAERHGASISVEASGNLQVKVRPSAFKRCLGNLVANAQRHADKIVAAGLARAALRLRSMSTTTGRALLLNIARMSFARSTGWMRRATRTKAAPALAWRSPATSPARMAATSVWGRARWEACGPACAFRFSDPACRPDRQNSSDRSVDPAHQFALGRGAGLLGGELAVLEHHQRRNRANAELARDAGVFVDIELGDFHLALHLAGDLFQRRPDHTARTAPFGPKIDDDRFAGLENVNVKIGVGDLGRVGHGFLGKRRGRIRAACP